MLKVKSEEPHWKHKPGLHRRGKWLSVFLSSLIHVNAVMTELVVWTLMEPVRVCVCVWQDNQKDLENATEQLSEYLERDISSDMLQDIKQKVQDKYR